jgi:hypothetical protein
LTCANSATYAARRRRRRRRRQRLPLVLLALPLVRKLPVRRLADQLGQRQRRV